MNLILIRILVANFSPTSIWRVLSSFDWHILYLKVVKIALQGGNLHLYCSGSWKPESSRRLCWRGMLGNLRRVLGIWNGEEWEGVEEGEVSSRVT